mgnify:CR=1 FL=1
MVRLHIVLWIPIIDRFIAIGPMVGGNLCMCKYEYIHKYIYMYVCVCVWCVCVCVCMCFRNFPSLKTQVFREIKLLNVIKYSIFWHEIWSRFYGGFLFEWMFCYAVFEQISSLIQNVENSTKYFYQIFERFRYMY